MNTQARLHLFLMSTKGDMAFRYRPLLNLIHDDLSLGRFTTANLKFNKDNPEDIIITDEYDGSVQLIINDDVNAPKLINSRFSIQENNTFNIPIHSGNAVTNVYDNLTFNKDSLLLKLYDKIPTLEFLGLKDGGEFKCGNYIFYFKLADADDNMTNIVQESSIVQVHMGAVNSKKIRLGMLDENAEKCIKFRLTDIDRGFDYVKIFYERNTSDASQAPINSYFMIDLHYPIRNGKCEILLTGKEMTVQIEKSDIRNEFADIQTVKTLTIVDNVLFFGNVSSYELDYQALQQFAWRIIPSVTTVSEESLGQISSVDYSYNYNNGYYNMQNVYYNVGYWPDEFYRFGIVYIYDNNILSPVFNILGCDLSRYWDENNIYHDPDNNDPLASYNTTYRTKFFKLSLSNPDYYLSYTLEPDDFFFNKKGYHNSKGVIKLPKIKIFESQNSTSFAPNFLQLRFDLSVAGWEGMYKNGSSYSGYTTIDALTFLRKHHIKGFFFVRQLRIPTIIAQGLVVGLTGRYNGSIPVLQNTNGDYITKSFLSSGRLLLETGSSILINSENVTNKALLVPDYDVNEATLNLIFTSLEFLLESLYNTSYKILGDHHCVKVISTDDLKTVNHVKLTAVPKDTKLVTDGENYFSSRAGCPEIAYETEDVNNRWSRTPPLNLTASNTLIRGMWGSYVGMSTDKFNYGDLVNIKLDTFSDSNQIEIEFLKRFHDYSLYGAISPRMNNSELDTTLLFICSRGDCYSNLFTHKMMNNFIDPELPTNTKIIDPACWCSNYAVRCTAEILPTTHSNLTSDSSGFYIPSPTKKSSIASMIFGILTGNIGLIVSGISDLTSGTPSMSLDKYANEIAKAFEIYIGSSKTPEESTTSTNDEGVVTLNMGIDLLIREGHIKKVNPKEQESAGGLNLKAIFKSDDKWELHGLSSINRADVNAVSFASWITFPINSRYNLAVRDIDYAQVTEETTMNKKRSFYPYEDLDYKNHLVESGIINSAAKNSLSSNRYTAYTTVPYIKLEFFNRIYWSKPNVAETFVNSYRIIFLDLFREYNKEFGAITKLLPLGNSLFVVFLHGMGLLPINKEALTLAEKSPYLSSKSVLPPQVLTLSKDYGSMWKDSIILTPNGYIYGVDTVAKKIWRVAPAGNALEFISDHKISKFLNDWINLTEYDFREYQAHINVKAHYNEFKHDVIFTYYKDIPIYTLDTRDGIPYGDPYINGWQEGKTWSLCYNEVLQNWITFYDWYPIESCNVDNIFFSFDKDEYDAIYNLGTSKMCIWKHGQAGLFSYLEPIKPTNWYGKLHEFNFEFVVNQDPHIQKIFNNLKIISNKTEPNKFEYEIVGEGYDWFQYKSIIQWINTKYKTDPQLLPGVNESTIFTKWYLITLSLDYNTLRTTYSDFPEVFGMQSADYFTKLPFLHIETADRKGISDLNKTYHSTDYWTPLSGSLPNQNNYSYNSSELVLIHDEQLSEDKVHTESLGNDMSKYGRVRGNMQYLEDLWDIEIRPISFRWAYVNNITDTDLSFIDSKESRHRDKFIKIKIRYSGKDLAVIQSIITMFDYSFA